MSWCCKHAVCVCANSASVLHIPANPLPELGTDIAAASRKSLADAAKLCEQATHYCGQWFHLRRQICAHLHQSVMLSHARQTAEISRNACLHSEQFHLVDMIWLTWWCDSKAWPFVKASLPLFHTQMTRCGTVTVVTVIYCFTSQLYDMMWLTWRCDS